MKIFFNAVLYDVLLNTISRNIEVPFRGAELGDFFYFLDETTEVVCRRILLTKKDTAYTGIQISRIAR